MPQNSEQGNASKLTTGLMPHNSELEKMMKLTLKIAARYIFSRKAHSAVNMISIVAVCGIVVTTVAMVCLMSVFNGFHFIVESNLAVLDPVLKVEPVKGKVISNADSLLNLVRRVDGVRAAVPVIQENALAVYDKKQLPVSVIGVDGGFIEITELASVTKDDGLYRLHYVDRFGDTIPCANLAVGTAFQLQAHPGGEHLLNLYAPKRVGRINIANPLGAFRADSLIVSSVYQVNRDNYDSNTLIVPIDIARHLFFYESEASSLHVALDSLANVDAVQKRIAETVGTRFSVKNRIQQHEETLRMINIEKWITLLFMGFILVIATFNVLSSISVLIVEKKRDVQTLRNIGAERGLAVGVFAMQSLLITVLGSLLGIVVGIGLCALQENYHLVKLAGDTSVMIIDYYPVEVLASDILSIFGVTVAISLVASLVTRLIARSRVL